MYVLDNWHKLFIAAVLIFAYGVGSSLYLQEDKPAEVKQSLNQMDDDGSAQQIATTQHLQRNYIYALGWAGVLFLIFLIFIGDLRRMLKPTVTAALALLSLSLTGCWRPFEPVKLEQIQSNEVAFLIPLVGNTKDQTSTATEEFYNNNLISVKQVKIPQQWVPKGFETMGRVNGDWKDAAVLIKVVTSPDTVEWTADENTGTSNRNEAIWVMTADQVEFSTGWTVTARIKDEKAAAKFLHNYPNGALTTVLNNEVRAKLQACFTLAVTDKPMDDLRKKATPIIIEVSKEITEFFEERGISITNIGITGGFVYKDKTIGDTMVKVFNAEQEKTMATAVANAQEEKNRKVTLEATGKAEAIMTEKKAEADAIKLVADARSYEIEQAKANLETYLQLKQLELNKELLTKWDGHYPDYFMSSGGTPDMLLQLPPVGLKDKSPPAAP